LAIFTDWASVDEPRVPRSGGWGSEPSLSSRKKAKTMASVSKEIFTLALPERVWDAVRDIGALHSRLVPGFVTDTRLEPGVRVVTFANGMVVREPIVSLDDAARRLVWTTEGGGTSHFNGCVQVFEVPNGGSRILWTSDFLPDSALAKIDTMMNAGASRMQWALDQLIGS
jgi:Polyketide cyclase / dehydrase and lipid transport